MPCGENPTPIANPSPQGIGIRLPGGADLDSVTHQVTHFLLGLGLLEWCESERITTPQGLVWRIRLREAHVSQFLPRYDALGLRKRLTNLTRWQHEDLLIQEISLTLFSAPTRIDFDDLEDLESHIRIRRNIAQAAEKTALAFKTGSAERPSEFWEDVPDIGFLLKPDAQLDAALIATTQPEFGGRMYDFSCCRATEYVILLGLAQEVKSTNSKLYALFEDTARKLCIKSEFFNQVFLTEYGSLKEPVPTNYYVPGDRVWFKNPDEFSSNAYGYEGSWVIYLGAGRFSNFWKRDAAYTLQDKMLEIYHWRHGASLNDQSTTLMNEAVVEEEVAMTRTDLPKKERVFELMRRYRDPAGVYDKGGCIDATREFPRQLGRIANELRRLQQPPQA